jgi:hypothetical protein
MQVATHEEFARRLTDCLRRRLQSDSLLTGAVAPDRSPRWPRQHHENPRASDIVTRCVRTARKDFLEGRFDSAAFQLGVASHYALDNMVPHAPPSRDHTLCESRFAEIDKDLEYPDYVQVELGDGRAAERAIRELAWMATTTPLNFEQRLTVAYACLLRIRYAVTEDPEPLEIIQELADAFVDLTSDAESRLQRYRGQAEAAVAELQQGEGTPSLGFLNAVCGPALRRCARGRAAGRQPGGVAAALGGLGLNRIRARLRAALEERLGPGENAQQLDLHVRSKADEYRQAIAGIRQRRMYWGWFNVQWGFWLEKGPLAVKFVRSEVGKAQGRLTRPVVDAFVAACAAQTTPRGR